MTGHLCLFTPPPILPTLRLRQPPVFLRIYMSRRSLKRSPQKNVEARIECVFSSKTMWLCFCQTPGSPRSRLTLSVWFMGTFYGSTTYIRAKCKSLPNSVCGWQWKVIRTSEFPSCFCGSCPPSELTTILSTGWFSLFSLDRTSRSGLLLRSWPFLT